MRMLVCLLVLSALSCCTPDAIKPGGYVAQGDVPKAKPVSDAVSPVRDAATQNSTSSALIARATRSLREDLAEATAEADRLRKVEAVTVEERNALWQRLTDLSHRSILLEGDAAQSQRLAADLTSRISDMEIAARNKDGEVELLRVQYSDERAKSKASHDLAVANGDAAEEWSHEANKLKGKVGLYDSVLIFIGVLVAIALAVKFGPLLLRKSVTGGI